MEELERINAKLEKLKCNLKIVIDKVYNYDKDCIKYDAYIEYFNTRREKWCIMHSLGYFSTDRKALDAAKDYLRINNYKF